MADDPQTVEEADLRIAALKKQRDKLAQRKHWADFRTRLTPFVQELVNAADDKVFREKFDRLRKEAQSFDAQASNLGSRT